MSNWTRPAKFKVTDSFKDHVARKSVNPGVDYACPDNSDVYAVHDGKVTKVINSISGAGGRVIHVDFGTYGGDYLHLSKILVKAGDHVKKGQVIGKSGGSGLGSENGYGNHLHFSFRKGDAVLINDGNIDYEKFLKEVQAKEKAAASK